MHQHTQAGHDAYHAGAVRLAPITTLLALGQGYAPLDAWYTGYDAAQLRHEVAQRNRLRLLGAISVEQHSITQRRRW